MCRVLEVGKSGYYNWLGKIPSKRWSENGVISSAIRTIFRDSIRIKTEKLNALRFFVFFQLCLHTIGLLLGYLFLCKMS